ncbi:hypothetical protein [Tautonia rosea]|uniref:hypothetical protein n=1 Tax=Tautonia rosea TaxID=2728037 RepID=UPI001473A333|nr:hypothetical protein [Tautonia rosea]
MTPPPLRYPLPTIVILVVLTILGWRGRDWLAAASASVWAGIERLRSGPPFPESNEPIRVGGPILRKVLLLRDGVEATDVPEGKPVETISRRIFADVYDIWPLSGEPTHYRIGNRRPIGWVEAGVVLPWNTRLVLCPTGSSLTMRADPGDREVSPLSLDSVPFPVLDWSSEAVRVAVWEPSEPWSKVQRRGWIRIQDVPPETFGVLVTRYELLELLRLAIEPTRDDSPPGRMMAVLGMLGSESRLNNEQREAARRQLPGEILGVRSIGDDSVEEQLGRINEGWNPDVSWSGIAFQAIPLTAIPAP